MAVLGLLLNTWKFSHCPFTLTMQTPSPGPVMFPVCRFLKISFIFREGTGEREGEKHQWVVASHTPPYWGPGCNPGMCHRLRIELMTLWFAGWHSVHWATQARANSWLLKGPFCFLTISHRPSTHSEPSRRVLGYCSLTSVLSFQHSALNVLATSLEAGSFKLCLRS